MWIDYQFAKRTAEATGEFVRSSGRYPLTGKGDINTYALFAELFSKLTKARGRAGVIVPTGIATDYTYRTFFSDLVSRGRLVQALMFDNAWKLFPTVHPDTPFGIFVFGYSRALPIFCGYALTVEQAMEPERRFSLIADDIACINPNTRTAPIFRSRADAELTAKLYSRAPILIHESGEEHGTDVSPWGITFQTRLWHMTEDAAWFKTARTLEREGWDRDGSCWVRPIGDRPEKSERMLPLLKSK